MDIPKIVFFTSTLLAASVLAFNLLKKKKKVKRFQVRPMNRNRHIDGQFHSLVKDMLTKEEDFDQYFKYTRMTPHLFKYLLSLVEPHLRKKIRTKNPISPAHRLTMTLQ